MGEYHVYGVSLLELRMFAIFHIYMFFFCALTCQTVHFL